MEVVSWVVFGGGLVVTLCCAFVAQVAFLNVGGKGSRFGLEQAYWFYGPFRRESPVVFWGTWAGLTVALLGYFLLWLSGALA